MLRKIINRGSVVFALLLVLYTFASMDTRNREVISVKDAANATECADLSGNWVDTSNSENCSASGGEWKDESCSIESYCSEIIEEDNSFIKPEDAINYVGENKMVCGDVIGGVYQWTIVDKPTFLFLGSAIPPFEFAITILGKDRYDFNFYDNDIWEVLDTHYFDKHICVEGVIKAYDDQESHKAQIVVSDNSQLIFK